LDRSLIAPAEGPDHALRGRSVGVDWALVLLGVAILAFWAVVGTALAKAAGLA
jgi:hypothetical protein